MDGLDSLQAELRFIAADFRKEIVGTAAYRISDAKLEFKASICELAVEALGNQEKLHQSALNAMSTIFTEKNQ